MKFRSNTFPLLIIASAALACNAYATPGGVLRTTSQRTSKTTPSRSPIQPTRTERWSLIKRSVSTGVYDMESYNYEPIREPIRFNEAAQAAETDVASKLRRPFLYLASAGFVCMLLSLIPTSSFAFLTNPLASYKASMARSPLITKVATGATLAVLGDGLAQVRDRDSTYSPRRAFSFAAFDGCYRFFQHNAFPLIITVCQGRLLGGILSALPGVTVGTNLRLGLAALERTLLYQLAVIPLLYYPIFFSFTGYLQGLTRQEIWARAKLNFFPCWKKNLLFWIPAQMVMFGLIPIDWQIPFACVMGMIWSTILSVVAGNAKTQD